MKTTTIIKTYVDKPSEERKVLIVKGEHLDIGSFVYNKHAGLGRVLEFVYTKNGNIKSVLVEFRCGKIMHDTIRGLIVAQTGGTDSILV